MQTASVSSRLPPSTYSVTRYRATGHCGPDQLQGNLCALSVNGQINNALVPTDRGCAPTEDRALWWLGRDGFEGTFTPIPASTLSLLVVSAEADRPVSLSRGLPNQRNEPTAVYFVLPRYEAHGKSPQAPLIRCDQGALSEGPPSCPHNFVLPRNALTTFA